MTTSAANSKMSDEKTETVKVSSAAGFLHPVSDILHSLVVRLLTVTVLATILISPVLNVIYVKLLSRTYQEIASNIAQVASHKPLNNESILETMRKYNLAWYYVTSSKGIVTDNTEPYAPNIIELTSGPSKVVLWRGKEHYEAVQALNNGKHLHIGFYAGPQIEPFLLTDPSAWVKPVPVAFALILGLVALAVWSIATFLLLTKPLEHLASFCKTLLAADSDEKNSGLDMPLAVTEVNKIAHGLRMVRSQYDEELFERISKEHNLKRQQITLEQQKEQLMEEYREHLFSTSRNISELTSKESEDEFLRALAQELDPLQSAGQICQQILDKLNNKFPNSINYAVFLNLDRQKLYRVQAFIGFDDLSLQAVRTIDYTSVVGFKGRLFSVEDSDFAKYGLDSVSAHKEFQSAIFLPLSFQQRNLGLLAVFFDIPRKIVNERIRTLKNVSDMASRALFRVTVLQEELESSRTDTATGLYNKQFFYELVPQLFDRAGLLPEEHPISLILIEGDHFKEISDTLGAHLGEQMLCELAKKIVGQVRFKDEGISSGRYKDYVIRYGTERILILLENTDSTRAYHVAERLRKNVQDKEGWPAGIGSWTISIGITTYPTDANNIEELLTKAETAISYVKEQLGGNGVSLWSKTPQGFKTSKAVGAMGGELGVFDPSGLLQSIAQTQKTGVLNVQSMNGLQLWMLFDRGKAVQARLGKCHGADAVVQFLSTFEDGKFNFQEREKTVTGNLPKLNESYNLQSYNLQKGLTGLIMDGMLALDNMNAAKKILPHLNFYALPVKSKELEEKIKALEDSSDPPAPRQWQIIGEILRLSNQDTSLTEVFRLLDNIPTALLWHSAATAVKHELVTLKPVALQSV